MPRRNTPKRRGSSESPGYRSSGGSRYDDDYSSGTPLGDALLRREPGPDGQMYSVRTVPGARATKIYRCPGCDHEIRVGVAHVVAWPSDFGDSNDRRHWHTGCWSGRGTRGVTRTWS